MKKNIKQLIKDNKLTIGTWMQMASPDVAEILSHTGYDWIALDLEHGVFNDETIMSCIRSIETGNSVPFVRIGEQTEKAIKTTLECGAKGIIIPMISSASELKQMTDFIQYPPQGKRGVGFSRANLYGANFNEYYKNINSNITIVAQIESARAVENLSEILKNEFLDAIMIGPYDLSASIGKAGDFNCSEFKSLLNEISIKVNESRILKGVHVVNPNISDLKAAISEGNKFIAYGTDALFLRNQALSFSGALQN